MIITTNKDKSGAELRVGDRVKFGSWGIFSSGGEGVVKKLASTASECIVITPEDKRGNNEMRSPGDVYKIPAKVMPMKHKTSVPQEGGLKEAEQSAAS